MGIRNIFTAKQAEVWNQVINDNKWTLMINSGAVRAGKTYVDNFIFLHELRRASALAKSKGEVGQFILAGADSGSIQSNILFELSNLGVDYRFDKNNFIHFNDKIFRNIIVKQAYTGTIAGLQHIRGMTSYGAYVNEATMANELVFDEIRNRCSVPGARVVCDTNPDVPTHYIKKLIDKSETSEFVVANNFTIDDNAENLGRKYIDSLKETTPTGVLYDRKILGLWVSGEGLVYRDYSAIDNKIKQTRFDELTKNKDLTYFCGVDFGFEHKGSIVLFAEDEDGNYYLIREYTSQHKQIEYYIGIAKEIQGEYGFNIPFYCDYARPEYIAQLNDNGLNAIFAYKRRLIGTEKVIDLFYNNKLKVIAEGINYFEQEIYEYVWDKKAGEPAKEDGKDDVMDTMRYAIATHMKDKEENMKDEVDISEQASVLFNNGFTLDDEMGV